ncbi:ATP-binding protein [Undibacterium sp. TC4M20W]|uniref:hybrid sensor histidine kinase/response regulator n=1 Tax=Undibacterium sp. TC4M20W TaxID=3413052 RepID=UPI003BF18110
MKTAIETKSVRGKLILMAMITTMVAVLVASAAMLIYDLISFQRSWINDLSTQAEIVGKAVAPALSFNDSAAAEHNLGMLSARPQILVGAIYDANGKRFAGYMQADLGSPAYPDTPGAPGYTIDGSELHVYYRVIENGEFLGTVYIREIYPLFERIKSYSMILVSVMLISLLLAGIVASRLQVAITRPLGAITDVARQVMYHRDFSLRVERRDGGEIGTLVGAFNDMLIELGRRADALEATNARLEQEVRIRESAEEALLQADRRKDEFLATLAHELRNPLAPIRTGLDILRMKEGDKAASAKARDIMERQLVQMVRLVDDLMDVSRINTGKLAIQVAPVPLHVIINNAVEIARPLIDKFAHQFEVQLPVQTVMIAGDVTRLAQIVSNLLNNAVKYTPQGGQIRLTAALDGKNVEIRIKDNGIGIALHMQESIFDMFSQADSSIERSNAGLGVGLSLARRLAELHGGSIIARSAGMGEGSEFILRLPALVNLLADEQQIADRQAADAKYRIFLVDDNVDFVKGFGELLELIGHTTQISHDGAEALSMAAAFRPDFAFLDIGLPHLNGYDLVRGLRLMPELKNTVMVAITGWGQEKDRQLALDAGFDAHSVKPVSFDQINAILSDPAHQRGSGGIAAPQE